MPAALMANVATHAPRRFRPAIVPTLATIAAVALFVTAGVWQHGRMNQKLALRAQLDVAVAQPPVPLPKIADWEAWRFRPVDVTGSFDSARQVLIDNKVQDGHPGFHVVTPLVTDDGRVVLVDRGWIAGGASRAELPAAPPPAGAVTLHGRVALPGTAYLELQKDVNPGPVWQNLDPQRFAQATGVAVMPIVIEQTAPLGPGDTLVRTWAAPDFGVDKHRIYMAQWFAFAALALGLWLYFALRRPR